MYTHALSQRCSQLSHTRLHVHVHGTFGGVLSFANMLSAGVAELPFPTALPTRSGPFLHTQASKVKRMQYAIAQVHPLHITSGKACFGHSQHAACSQVCCMASVHVAARVCTKGAPVMRTSVEPAGHVHVHTCLVLSWCALSVILQHTFWSPAALGGSGWPAFWYELRLV